MAECILIQRWVLRVINQANSSPPFCSLLLEIYIPIPIHPHRRPHNDVDQIKKVGSEQTVEERANKPVTRATLAMYMIMKLLSRLPVNDMCLHV